MTERVRVRTFPCREKGCGARMTIPYVVEPNGTQWRVVHEGTWTHRLQVTRPVVLDQGEQGKWDEATWG